MLSGFVMVTTPRSRRSWRIRTLRRWRQGGEEGSISSSTKPRPTHASRARGFRHGTVCAKTWECVEKYRSRDPPPREDTDHRWPTWKEGPTSWTSGRAGDGCDGSSALIWLILSCLCFLKFCSMLRCYCYDAFLAEGAQEDACAWGEKKMKISWSKSIRMKREREI